MNRTELETLIAAVLDQSQNIHSEVHGPRHWISVSYLGVELARLTVGADPLVAFLFGLFYDSMRENEHDDPELRRRIPRRILSSAAAATPTA